MNMCASVKTESAARRSSYGNAPRLMSWPRKLPRCCGNKDDFLDALNNYLLELELYESELSRYYAVLLLNNTSAA